MEEYVRSPWRLSSGGERWFDRLLVLALMGPVLVDLITHWPVGGVLAFAQTFPLLWRRRWPVPVFVVICASCALQVLALDAPLVAQVAFPIAVYSVARYARARWGYAAVAVGLLAAGLASWDWVSAVDDVGSGTMDVKSYVVIAISIATFPVAAWALGTLARTRAAYVDSLVERNEQLRREAEQRAELGATQERARIAREMHDLVAHGLSVIVVQADGARYAAEQDPSLAPKALETVGQAAREALAEMRQLLGLLRDGDAMTRPQPRLSDIATLVEETRAGGMELSAGLPEPGLTVPEGIALTAFRVVQEALSNVRKHAGPGASARVTVTADEDALEIEVTDDGRGAAAAAAEDAGGLEPIGLGLVGMRERITAHDGVLEAGPAVGGGFRVYARMPL